MSVVTPPLGGATLTGTGGRLDLGLAVPSARRALPLAPRICTPPVATLALTGRVPIVEGDQLVLTANAWTLRNPTIDLNGGSGDGYEDESWTTMVHVAAEGANFLMNGFSGTYSGHSYANTIYANVVWRNDVFAQTLRAEKVCWWNGASGSTEITPENTTDPTPKPRHPYGMWVEIPDLGRIDLINGANSSGHPHDHWSYAYGTATWTQRVADLPFTSAGAPGHEGSAAWSSGRERIVYYLGEVNDTYLYNPTGDAYTLLQGSSAMGTLMGARLADDPLHGRMLCFGGGDYPNGSSELWALDDDATQWTQIAYTGATPPARKMHVFAYDSVNDRFVIAGGEASEGGTARTDTYVFNPFTHVMTQMTPTAGYTNSGQSAGCYDAAQHCVVLHSGANWWLYRLPDNPARVSWNPVGDADLAGYRLYLGTTSGVYTQVRDVGLVTTYNLERWQAAGTYYVRVVAVDADANESPLSDEVTVTW